MEPLGQATTVCRQLVQVCPHRYQEASRDILSPMAKESLPKVLSERDMIKRERAIGEKNRSGTKALVGELVLLRKDGRVVGINPNQ